MSKSFLNIVEEKISIASKLNDGDLGGSYYEGVLLISIIISSMASILWPGEGFDRYRFVELLIKYNNSNDKFSDISIPLLKGSSFLTSEQRNKIFSEYNLKSSSQILVGRDIDSTENDIINLCPEIELKELRKYSYGNIFYKYIRSSIVHEYSISDKATSYPMTVRSAFVSYNNNLEPPNRRIFFQFNSLVNITTCIANNIAFLVENAPIIYPKEWWLDGLSRG